MLVKQAASLLPSVTGKKVLCWSIDHLCVRAAQPAVLHYFPFLHRLGHTPTHEAMSNMPSPAGRDPRKYLYILCILLKRERWKKRKWFRKSKRITGKEKWEKTNGGGNKILEKEEGKSVQGGTRMGKPESMMIICPTGNHTIRNRQI